MYLLFYNQELKLTQKNPFIEKPSVSNNRHSTSNEHYVKLQVLPLKVDLSQFVFPYFDGQQVGGNPGYPLSGIGIIHRGSSENAGYLSLKLISLHYAKILDEYAKQIQQ